MTYKQRFKSYYQYFSDLLEDIFAVTLCLPFIFILYTLTQAFFFFAPFINRIYENNGGALGFWRSARDLCTFPLYALKGIADLSIAPLLASIAAIFLDEPSFYPFHGHRFLQNVIAMGKPNGFIFASSAAFFLLKSVTPQPVLNFISQSFNIINSHRAAATAVAAASWVEGRYHPAVNLFTPTLLTQFKQRTPDDEPLWRRNEPGSIRIRL